MAHTKVYVKQFIREGVEVEIYYLKTGILFSWNFLVFGHNLSFGILYQMTKRYPSYMAQTLQPCLLMYHITNFFFPHDEVSTPITQKGQVAEIWKKPLTTSKYFPSRILRRRKFINSYVQSMHLPVFTMFGSKSLTNSLKSCNYFH